MSEDVDKIFDAFNRFSDQVHKADEIRKLTARINAPKTCGDCDKWMKSRECPKEGITKGLPHMNESPCNEYIESSWTTQFRQKLSDELLVLKTASTHD